MPATQSAKLVSAGSSNTALRYVWRIYLLPRLQREPVSDGIEPCKAHER